MSLDENLTTYSKNSPNVDFCLLSRWFQKFKKMIKNQHFDCFPNSSWDLDLNAKCFHLCSTLVLLCRVKLKNIWVWKSVLRLIIHTNCFSALIAHLMRLMGACTSKYTHPSYGRRLPSFQWLLWRSLRLSKWLFAKILIGNGYCVSKYCQLWMKYRLRYYSKGCAQKWSVRASPPIKNSQLLKIETSIM